MLRIRTLGAGLGASLLTVVAGAGVALAADLPNYEPPPAAAYTPAPAWSWTGPYAGLTGGYAWGTAAPGTSSSGWVGGGFVGYNLQTNQNLVVGIEGDVTATSKASNPWNGTFRGRLGYTWDRFMLYGTAGLAVGGVHDTGTPSSATKVGWTAGAGLEAAITDNVTGRIEYRHTDLGTHAGSSYTSNDVLVGIGFKF